MAGHAHPTAALPDPGIGEPAAVDVGLTVERSLFVVSAINDHGIAVNAGLQRIVAYDLNVFDWMLDAIKKLGLVLHAAVDIDIGEVVGQQMIERGSIFRYFGLVPEGFKSQDARGIAVLCGLRIHRGHRQQSGKQKDPASEPRQAATVVQSIVPPHASYISNRQNVEPTEEYIGHFMRHLIATTDARGRIQFRD